MAKFNSKNQMSKVGDKITVRNATTADVEKMHSLGILVFRTTDFLLATAEEFAAIPIEQQLARIKRLEDNENDIWLIAECNEEVIGMIDFLGGKSKKVRHKGSCGMLVNPSWQRKGIGGLLISSLIEWVQAHPYLEVINLTVSEENKSAIALYKKFDFQVTGKEPYGLKMPDGQFLVDLTMTLKP